MCPKSTGLETACREARFPILMNRVSTILSPADDESSRKVIRVDGYPDKIGIAAALRRAFQPERPTEMENDFALLLARIH